MSRGSPSRLRLTRCRFFEAVSRALLFLGLTAVLGGFAPHGVLAAQAESPGMDMLRKMQEAARTLDYAGVYTYQQGSVVLSTRIVHVVDGTGERERVLVLDGRPREYIRHNETTQCLLPERKLVLVERRDSDRFPAVLFDEGDNLQAHYDMQVSDTTERVAGRPCHELRLAPRDSQRYGYRFCADKETGLALRAQTIGPEGVLIQIVFNTLEVGSDVSAEALSPGWNTKDWKVVELPVHKVDLASEGWRIPLPPGYRQLTQMARQMKADRHVKQLVASDGLSTISVFIEAYSETASHPHAVGLVREGAMNVYRKRIGDHWLTVLGEVPADTVRDLAHRTEYVPLAVP